MNKGLILLSGGLDSLVSLACAKDEYNISTALTFDYGQKAFVKEKEASSNICNYYGIQHRVISLDWLALITHTSLVANEEVPYLDNEDLDEKILTEESSKAVWVPNRNGLFINIAGSFADSFGFTHIVFGANKEEGATFKDNTPEFVDAVNLSLKHSVNQPVRVIAPLIDYDKNQIVDIAVKKNVPLKLVRSCYLDGDSHCGECESCLRLKRALASNNRHDLINLLF
ncbi:MAG: 7-cyano-7-deazaguanine synthase QueC [Candidatus Gastranaerophilales bacterium]|nr:7-cyano-7-deazaguanine synthase QueC [Candidatus Gastranaerophilales bacterium]